MSAHDLTPDRLPDSLSAQDALALLARLTSGDGAIAEALPNPSHSQVSPTGRDGFNEEFVALIAQVLKLDTAEVPLSRPLTELGLDSISATDLMARFNEHFGLSVPSTILFEFDNVTDLSTHLWDSHVEVMTARFGRTTVATAPNPQTPPPAAHPSNGAFEPMSPVKVEVKPPARDPSDMPRIDVQTMWAQIERSLTSNPLATSSPDPHEAPTDAWHQCSLLLSRLLPGSQCIAFPDEVPLLALLRNGEAKHRLLWLSASPAPDGAMVIDPAGDNALEQLLKYEQDELIVCLPAGEALANLPVHLWRALERMRARSGSLLALSVTQPDRNTLGALRDLDADCLWIGKSPLIALVVTATAAKRFSDARLNAARSAYRNEYAAQPLFDVLSSISSTSSLSLKDAR